MLERVAAHLEAHLRSTGITSAAAIQTALGISQPTLSRAIAALGPVVIRIGRARATHYAHARNVGLHGSSWPLYRIDAEGRAATHGTLTALHGEAFAYSAQDYAELWHAGTRPPGAFAQLPWFLADLRPGGFLGQHYARRHATELGRAAAPRALAHGPRHGRARSPTARTCPATSSSARPCSSACSARTCSRRPPSPPPIAARATPNSPPKPSRAKPRAPSLGGEFPKFATCVHLGDDRYRHVLVKFTETANTPAKRRWVDLLICEHLAARVLAGQGIAAAASELVVAGERLCLEVERFDRIGAHGRRGTVTLAALDDAFHDQHDDWPHAAARLARDGWIDAATLATIRWLHAFGMLIANTDLHFGNLSFHTQAARPLALAPAYDMLPMLYRPAATGEIVEREFQPPLPLPEARASWQLAATLATTFWRAVEADARVSLPFRRIASANAALIQKSARRGVAARPSPVAQSALLQGSGLADAAPIANAQRCRSALCARPQHHDLAQTHAALADGPRAPAAIESPHVHACDATTQHPAYPSSSAADPSTTTYDDAVADELQ